MTDDHQGRTSEKATLQVRAADEILGTHKRHMQDGQAVLATGKRHIAVMGGQVLADPGKDHRLVMDGVAQRKKPLAVQAGRAVAGGVPSRSPLPSIRITAHHRSR
jgi:hypothetical protein